MRSASCRTAAGAQNLAEFGVVFLMFSIGLEFSLVEAALDARASCSASACAGDGDDRGGGARSASCCERWVHISWQASVALGGALAMSSTAIVSKMLAERLEIETGAWPQHLRRAAVPGSGRRAAADHHRGVGQRQFAKTRRCALGIAAIKIVVALTLLLIIGQKLHDALVQSGRAAPLAGTVHAESVAGDAGRGVHHRQVRAVARARRVHRGHADRRDALPASGGRGHQAVSRRAARALLRDHRHAAQSARDLGASAARARLPDRADPAEGRDDHGPRAAVRRAAGRRDAHGPRISRRRASSASCC